jgi:hypothetical protein
VEDNKDSEVASMAALEVAVINVSANKSPKNKAKITTKFWESKEMHQMQKSKRSSKSWQFSTIQTRIRTIQRGRSKNSRKLQTRMKL